MYDTARQYYWDTNAAGQPEYVTIKRSYSHGHRKNHDCQYYTVSHEEWNRLVNRTRLLDEANQSLGAQNDALRLSLSNAEAQIAELCADNDSLRNSIGSGRSSSHHRHHHHHSSDKSRRKIARLEKENERVREDNFDLRWRIRELSKQLDDGNNRRTFDLQSHIDHWMRKYHDMRARYDSLLESLHVKSDKILVYEDILRRNGFLN